MEKSTLIRQIKCLSKTVQKAYDNIRETINKCKKPID